MSNPCQGRKCPNGTCPGCRNGQQYPEDPACFPYCPGSTMVPYHDVLVSGVVVVILLCFLVMGILIWFGFIHKTQYDYDYGYEI